MDCSKLHVTRDMSLLLSTGRSKYQQYSHRLPFFVHRTVGILLADLNSHKYILFMVVFTIAGGLSPGSDLCICL